MAAFSVLFSTETAAISIEVRSSTNSYETTILYFSDGLQLGFVSMKTVPGSIDSLSAVLFTCLPWPAIILHQKNFVFH